jgi:hypothetical protein
VRQESTLSRIQACRLTLALWACGGGGGGDSGGGPASPPVSGGSGLIPTAPALGATLANDATTLRPLVTNAVWTYRGVESDSGTSTVYTNTVSHQASGAGEVSESGTNQANLGAYQQNVSHRSGEVHVSSTVDLGNGQSQTVDQLELRSPVRVNDQVTHLDVAGADLGTDLDGDGRNETLDVASYSRVIGEETLDLVSFPGVSAVRVSTFVVARVRGTRGQTATDTSTLDTWYAPGIGIVRIGTDLPNSIGGRTVTNETLVNYDGVVQGVGFLPPRAATSPFGVRQRFMVDAVGFGTHALLMSYAGAAAVDGIAMSKVDVRGQVQSTVLHAGISAGNARMARVAGEARVVYLDNTGLAMRAFDSSGNTIGVAPTLLKPGAVSSSATGEQFVLAGAGDVMWLVWFEFPVSPSTQYTMRARPFDAAGLPLAADSVLVTTGNPGSVRDLKANGSPGHAIVSWNEGALHFYALMQGAAAPTLHATGISNGTADVLFPAATATGAALMWKGAVGATGAWQPFGVRFDALGEPWWTGSGGIPGTSESLALGWISNAVSVKPAVGGGTPSLDLLAVDSAKLWPEDITATQLSVVTEITPGDRPLAANPQARLLARGALPMSMSPHLVGLSNNVLLFVDEPAGVTITSVWRRP